MWRLQAIIGGIGAFAIWMLYIAAKKVGVNSVKLEVANHALLEQKVTNREKYEILKNVKHLSNDDIDKLL